MDPPVLLARAAQPELPGLAARVTGGTPGLPGSWPSPDAEHGPIGAVPS